MSAKPRPQESEEPEWLREIRARCNYNATHTTAAQRMHARVLDAETQRVRAISDETQAKARAQKARHRSDAAQSEHEARWQATIRAGNPNPTASGARRAQAGPSTKASTPRNG